MQIELQKTEAVEESDGVFRKAPLIRTANLCKTFGSGKSEIVPLSGIDLNIESGEMVAIMGPSGAGKSTFLHLLAALDTPTSGTVYFAEDSLQALSELELAAYRTERVGFIWQRHHLMPDFTAAENIAMPLLVRGMGSTQALKKAEQWLQEIGLADRADQRAAELSGGEQQRVAIARALVNEPELLLADEPTGDLDERNAELVFDLMQRLHQSYRLTSVIATHNYSLARRADRLLILEHGRLMPGNNRFEESPSVTSGAQPQESAVTRV